MFFCYKNPPKEEIPTKQENPIYLKELNIVKNPNGLKIYKEAVDNSSYKIIPYQGEFFSSYPPQIKNELIQISWNHETYFTKQFLANEIFSFRKLDIEEENHFFTKKMSPLYKEPNTESKIIITLPAYTEIQPLYASNFYSDLKIDVVEFQDYPQYNYDFFRIEYNDQFYFISQDYVERIYSEERLDEFKKIKKIHETNYLSFKSKKPPLYKLLKKANSYSLKKITKYKQEGISPYSTGSILYKNIKYYESYDSEGETYFISQKDCSEVLDPVQFSNSSFQKYVNPKNKPILTKFKEIYQKEGFYFDYSFHSVKRVPFSTWKEVYLVTVNDYTVKDFESSFPSYHGHKRSMLFRKNEDSYIALSGSLATEDKLRILDIDGDGNFEMILQYQYRMLSTSKILYLDDGKFIELVQPPKQVVDEIYDGGLILFRDEIGMIHKNDTLEKKIYQFKNRKLTLTDFKIDSLKNRKKLFP